MKTLKTLMLAGMLIAGQAASAAEIVGEARDNTAGSVFGGAGGLLVGGAIAGGPAGALLGGLVGLVSGRFFQDQTGLSERAYDVRTGDGQVVTVRSPNETFETGEEVSISGNRLH